MSLSLKQIARRGVIWSVASNGAEQFLRFGRNLILSRLLFPEIFGLMALTYIFITGLELFSDIGVGPSIIQNKRGEDPVFLNTAWTIQVLRGFVLWLMCLAITWPVAHFYGESQLLWLMPVIGLNTVIQGFNSTKSFTLQRRLAIRELTIYDFGGEVFSTGVTIIWTWLSPTIWALVGANILSTLCSMIWSHFLVSGYWNRFTWEPKAAKEIFDFGRWIFLSTAATFLGMQTDRLILGKLLSFRMLGIYGLAFNLANLPKQFVDSASERVLFPTVSKLAHLPRTTLRGKILKNRWTVLIPLAVGLAALVSYGDFLILLLYDDRYAQAAWMFPLITLGLWPGIMTQTVDPILFAIGQPRYTAYGCFLRFLWLLIGLPFGFYLMGGTQGAGIPATVAVVSFAEFPYYVAINYGLWREGLNFIEQDIKATALFVALLSIMILGRNFAGF